MNWHKDGRVIFIYFQSNHGEVRQTMRYPRGTVITLAMAEAEAARRIKAWRSERNPAVRLLSVKKIIMVTRDVEALV